MIKSLSLSFCLCTLVLLCAACNSSSNSVTPGGSGISAANAKQGFAEQKKLGVISDNYLNDQELRQQLHPTLILSNNGAGYAYIEPFEGKYRVVHNGKRGKLYKSVGDITISNDGAKVAYSVAGNDTFRRVVVNELEGPLFIEIGMPEFTPDSRHVVYTITQKDETYIVVDHKVVYGQKIAQGPILSADSQRLAFATALDATGRQQFVISDLLFKDRQVFDACGETFAASSDTSRLAVVCTDKDVRAVKVIDFASQKIVAALKPHAGGKISRITFSPDNRSVAYTYVVNDDQRYLVYNGKEMKIPVGDEFMSLPLVFAEPNGVGVIAGMAVRMGLINAFAKEPRNERNFGYISDFIVSKDGRHHAYLGIELGGESRQRLVVDGHEGAKFDRIVSPQFSPDGGSVIFRARQDGKRFLAVANTKGAIIRQHQNYDMVFQPVISSDGTSVGYGALIGNELWWKVEKL